MSPTSPILWRIPETFWGFGTNVGLGSLSLWWFSKPAVRVPPDSFLQRRWLFADPWLTTFCKIMWVSLRAYNGCLGKRRRIWMSLTKKIYRGIAVIRKVYRGTIVVTEWIGIGTNVGCFGCLWWFSKPAVRIPPDSFLQCQWLDIRVFADPWLMTFDCPRNKRSYRFRRNGYSKSRKRKKKPWCEN